MTDRDLRCLVHGLEHHATVQVFTWDGTCYVGIPTALRFRQVMACALGAVELRGHTEAQRIDFREIVEVCAARSQGSTIAGAEARASADGGTR